MNRFESQVVKTLNTFFSKAFINAFAYRFPKANRYSTQYCDVLVDSRDVRFFLAIECKSTEADVLYFSTFHVRKDGTHQLDTLRNFVERTERTGFIAIELKHKAYLVPLGYVYRKWRDGKKGLDIINIKTNGCPLQRYVYNLQGAPL